MARRLSRRRLLQLASVLPLGALITACSSASQASKPPTEGVEVPTGSTPITPTSTPEPPFVVAEGEERRFLMAGTPQQTPLYIFGSGLPGKIMLVLGGVHGNEPGGWLAAGHVAQSARPAHGALLVIPEANRIAMAGFVRTTDTLGDLNRLYPGDPNGLPMARMAYQIVQAIREFHVDVVVDMHESWAFYKDRPQNGTAYLGQTVATAPTEPAASFARSVVEAVNTRIQSPQEELFFREFPPNRLPSPESQRPFDTSGNPQAAVSGGSRSSLGLPNHVPGLSSLLVEMGQQQSLERRIGLHIEVFQEAARRLSIIDA